MSVQNGERLATKQDLADLYSGILPYLGGSADAGFTPIGTIIAVFAETAPINYLACDGSTYNKSDYPELASHLLALTDHSAYEVSGDNTKFKVPDLRGEFLRGTGTNSHTNQGSGAGVGVHQDATYIPSFSFNGSAIQLNSYGNTMYMDTLNKDSGLDRTKSATVSTNVSSETGNYGQYTSRPTNTSVLFCIATKNIFLNPALDYSTTEKIIGTDENGNPIYQKTFSGTLNSSSGAIIDVSSLNIATCRYTEGYIISGANTFFFPYVNDTMYYMCVNYYNSTNHNIVIVGKNMENANYNLTIRYTKSNS